MKPLAVKTKKAAFFRFKDACAKTVNAEDHIVSMTLKMVCPLQVMVSKYSVGLATHSATTTMKALNWSTQRMTKLVSLLKVCSLKRNSSTFFLAGS